MDRKSGVRGRRGRSAHADERREGTGAGRGWKNGMGEEEGDGRLKNKKM